MFWNVRRNSGWFTERQLRCASSTLPMPGVDFVPARGNSCGAIALAEIILHHPPFRETPVWRHRDGRARKGETVSSSVRRHPGGIFGINCPLAAPPAPRHPNVFARFRDHINSERDISTDAKSFDIDPRNHVIRIGFIVKADEALSVHECGEPLSFFWAESSDLDSYLMWPNSREFIYRSLDDWHATQSCVRYDRQ